jgi:hypothetical protein
MGYLDNSSITVDAILTKKGRELLSQGQSNFNISQFALADDEIDYDLWNPAHPLGSDYYGIVIENMPLVEATPDESNIMRYKLITLPKQASRIPVISVGQAAITLSPSQTFTVRPTTTNFVGGNSTLGYTAILSNSDAATISVDVPALSSVSPSVPRFIGDAEAAQTVSVTGLAFTISAKSIVTSGATATLTIIGNETGGRAVINITVLQANILNSNTSFTN